MNNKIQSDRRLPEDEIKWQPVIVRESTSEISRMGKVTNFTLGTNFLSAVQNHKRDFLCPNNPLSWLASLDHHFLVR